MLNKALIFPSNNIKGKNYIPNKCCTGKKATKIIIDKKEKI